MTRVEDEWLLKMQGTSILAYNYTYLSHHYEGTLPYSILCHARFGNINYGAFIFWKIMVLLVFLLSLGNSLILASLENKTKNSSTIPLIKDVENLDWYILICVPPYIFHISMVINIYFLLMITLGFVVCTYWKINHNLLILKTFMFEFKMKHNYILSLFIHI